MKPLPPIPNLADSIWTFVGQIPEGEVTTFGTIAKALGDVSASRYVGQLMLHHDHQPECVCHRIVRADGTIGKFVQGTNRKAELLRREGHVVEHRPQNSSGSGGNSTDYSMAHSRRWADFRGDPPLAALADFQRSLATSAVIEPIQTGQAADQLDDQIQVEELRIAGVDVSFVPNSSVGVAAYAEVSLRDATCVYSKTHQAEVAFPYVSGYLAFRELPLLTMLLKQVTEERKLADLLVVDGSGILHPRQAGIAMMLGLLCDVPTIGVTKKHLCGQVDLNGLQGDAFREILVEGVTRGFAMLPGSGTSKPIYISPGHRCDPVSALAVVQNCRLGRRLPEPIYWADRLSRSEAKRIAKTSSSSS